MAMRPRMPTGMLMLILPVLGLGTEEKRWMLSKKAWNNKLVKVSRAPHQAQALDPEESVLDARNRFKTKRLLR